MEQHNVMYAIEYCRTSAYGFHADICDKCGYIESAYNLCRNRHCPECQGIAKRRWVEKRLDEVQKKFKQWRNSPDRRKAIPKALWEAAASLYPAYSRTVYQRP